MIKTPTLCSINSKDFLIFSGIPVYFSFVVVVVVVKKILPFAKISVYVRSQVLTVGWFVSYSTGVLFRKSSLSSIT